MINGFQDNLDMKKRKSEQKKEFLSSNNSKTTPKTKDNKIKFKNKKTFGFQLIPQQTFEEEDIEEISSENIISRRNQHDKQP